MSKVLNTLFLRLEGPMQAWGTQESKFVVRRAGEAPTKSGVIGLLCAAMGISRTGFDEWLPVFNSLAIGVRIDRPGMRMWDYHTVGAGIGSLTAQGKIKRTATTKEIETLVSRREYLCDASFLVALQGKPDFITDLHEALIDPVWTLYLGRKSCPPSVPIYNGSMGSFSDTESALRSVPWRPRLKWDKPPALVTCIIDWMPSEEIPHAPVDAEIWYDVPDSFDPPSHHPRFVIRKSLAIGLDVPTGNPMQQRTPAASRPRADYTNSEWKKVRNRRLDIDRHICVFCKSGAKSMTVQHVTYRHAGGGERLEELRTLCRLCHDAVTMIEYGENMGMDRINPEDPKWRDRIILQRQEIIAFRSLATRKRKLAEEEIE